MKNLLILYLLTLSPQIIGQNSVNIQDNYFVSNFNDEIVEPPLLTIKNLIPVSIQTNKTYNNNWLIDKDIVNEKTDSKDFSSLILIDHLSQLNNVTPFSVSHNATLERFIRVYLKDRRENLDRLLGKSIYYFPIFEQYLDKYELPLELKYLAVVESALNPVAVSPSGAKGMWQFMYGTGLEYDLYIDSYVDERLDPIKSTEAACIYLKHLHKTFGDWDLALAAYNSGPGNVKKAIKRAGGNKNYWEIRKYLPRETSSYVPAFYATMYLFTYADYHSLKPEKSDVSYFNTDTLHLKGNLSFEAIKNHTGIDNELLKALNTQYKKDFIPLVPNRVMSLTLPVNMMPVFLENESEAYHNKSNANMSKSNKVIRVTATNSYLVRKGDNLNSIAKIHGISLEQLKIWNGLDTNFLIEGQRLVITSKKTALLKTTSNSGLNQTRKTTLLKKTNGFIHYTVEHGDTLFKISRKFDNIPISELRMTNNLYDVNYLKPGMELKIRNEKNNNPSQTISKS
ncbi:transglycosylase SLT domain-containing protein [Lutimonas halocynthiae]|uniref:lytic transglycosylase domain-containing protein n=1 Tax=Lutimonas halocynthiae TaxID=1446477 RepID=UPI0025B3F091|nr:lytic transglycosylase domain-containing protein [Lutimonas halocynthiae]MDN3642679.1 transglycosylase SLT domain-containing protein [Lutimonas halocynthiae]